MSGGIWSPTLGMCSMSGNLGGGLYPGSQYSTMPYSSYLGGTSSTPCYIGMMGVIGGTVQYSSDY